MRFKAKSWKTLWIYVIVISSACSHQESHNALDSGLILDGAVVVDGASQHNDATRKDALAGRCFESIEGYTATLVATDLITDSLSEVWCDENSDVCYEQVALYEDGIIVYQNIRLGGGSKDCIVLATMPLVGIASLQESIALWTASDSVSELLSIECDPQDPMSNDYAVDRYRGQKRPGLMQTIIAGYSCRGHAGSEELKILLDEFWGMAPRSIDFVTMGAKRKDD